MWANVLVMKFTLFMLKSWPWRWTQSPFWHVLTCVLTCVYMQRTQGSGSFKGRTVSDESFSADTIPDPFVQNLFVLCHGEHVKNVDIQSGAAKVASPPWDPPLTERGKLQARRVGREIRLEDWNVTRVVMSPFLRCVQTAVEVIAGLSSVDDPESGNGSPDNSTIKVWFCYKFPPPQFYSPFYAMSFRIGGT